VWQGRKGRERGGGQGGDRGEEVRPLHPRLCDGKEEVAGTKEREQNLEAKL